MTDNSAEEIQEFDFEKDVFDLEKLVNNNKKSKNNLTNIQMDDKVFKTKKEFIYED
eukprot:CAMPEP_0116895442 /NCGR_PEP_ID=MMETSP0467-20121206/4957_1 /TAXON_ID=283647 /ORGANISM="Mesodinium pulex, Strain SPMC105" /LENGTH=55 /DNA_ID=CAMNT_0004566159 /DNA_START=106 /DNA_END=273 /DNA_ORIENTATION=+